MQIVIKSKRIDPTGMDVASLVTAINNKYYKQAIYWGKEGCKEKAEQSVQNKSAFTSVLCKVRDNCDKNI
ncbi:hypothetical protein MIDIC_140013 [Alphaproteobacteria bacterium]